MSLEKNEKLLIRVKLEKIKKEMEHYRNGWQRAQADYQNLKKETETKRSEQIRMSEWQVLEEFLPLYDHLKKAIEHAPKEENKLWQNWSQGIGFIKKQFGDILKQHRIEEIKTVGEMFNPTKHECVSEEGSDQADGIVLKELETGYEMGGKILKATKVIISKSEEKAE